MPEKHKEWFSDVRFGMFIHWGLYSITGRDMWYYSNEHVEKEHYERLFDRFNPVDYDPTVWAKLAKQAGMKYAVFTAKHHDGFCLYDSQYTEFKVTNTRYGKDTLRMWMDAFRAEGIRIGIYYSLIDWNHPHFTVDSRHPQRGRHEELNEGRDFSIYQDYLHNQVSELLTEYGKIDVLWFDFSYGPSVERGLPGKAGEDWKAMELREKILKLQPEIMINNRLDIRNKDGSSQSTVKEFMGDFSTPEQFIPSADVSVGDVGPRRWEACETIGSSWGYYRGDGSIKSVQEIVKHLVTCVSNNGNLLLNVGPTARGRIQPEFVERLQAVGEWLELNGESIFGAGASLYKLAKSCPELHPLFTQKNNDLYMHLLDGKYPPYPIILNGLGGKVDYIEFVGDKTEIEFDEVEWDGAKHVRLYMPIINPDPNDTVIRILLKEEIC
jgi:alpha-L-fucosidase